MSLINGMLRAVEGRNEKECKDWNERNAVGVPVNYRDDLGKLIPTATRSEAYVLSGHTPVIFVDKFAGCVRLDRVSVRP